MKRIYRIAEKNIEIDSLFPVIHEYCEDYRTEGDIDFSVKTEKEDIEQERRLSEEEDRYEGRVPLSYDDESLELLAVYRKIAEQMPRYDTFLFHGSVIALDGVAYAFTAKSGTGKSTHTRLWREVYGNRTFMVNDDKPLLRVQNGAVTAFGTPWDGKHRLSTNAAVPLTAVCILERAEENHIEPVSKREAYPLLLQQTYRPADTGMLMKTLTLLDQLMDLAGLYRLGCNMERAAAIVACEGMKGDRS